DRMQARYAEALQRTALLLCGRTHDVVLPEQADLVERHGTNGVRQRPSEGCDEARQPERERDVGPAVVGPFLRFVQQLAEGEDLRAAGLVDRTRLAGALDSAGDGVAEVSCIDRLEPRTPAPDQRQKWS